MSAFVPVLVILGSLAFAGAGVFAIVHAERVARFVEERGITLRIGAPVEPTSDNIRLIGIVWVAVGLVISVISLIAVATHSSAG